MSREQIAYALIKYGESSHEGTEEKVVAKPNRECDATDQRAETHDLDGEITRLKQLTTDPGAS